MAALFFLLETLLIVPSVTAGAAEESISFRAQGVPHAFATDVVALAQRQVIQAFLDQHTQIEIEAFSMPEVAGAGLDSGPLMAIAAGIPPHAIYVNFRQSSTFIEQGFLEPLEVLLARVLSKDTMVRQIDNGQWAADPTLAEIEIAVEAIRARTPPQAWDVVYREDESRQQSGKHVWALPTSTLVMALLYRKDLFNEAGLNPDHAPADWDEFERFARRLTVPHRQQYGLMIPGGRGLGFGSYSLLVSNGTRVVGQNDQGQWEATYDSNAAAEAIELIWRLARQPFERDGQVISGAIKFGTTELETLWKRGQIAMRFGYLDEEMLGDLNPQLVGIAPLPLSRRGTRGSELNCRMLGVFSGASPAQQLAVMRYMWFITSEEAQRIRARVYVDNGFGEFLNPDVLEKFGYDRLLKRVPAGWKEAFGTALAHGVPEPYGRNTQYIYRYLTDPIERALELNLKDVPRDQAVAQIKVLLEASAEEANTKLLGNLPDETLRTRRIVAGLVVGLLGVGFLGGGVLLWRFFDRSAPISTEGGRGRTQWAAWSLLFPALGLTFAWLYIPLAGGLVLAFTDYRLVIESSFVGLDNFAHVLYDVDFWMGLGRTVYFVTLMVGLGFWPPILLAILLDEVPTAVGKYIFRTVFYLPAVISGVIVMFLWKQLYDPTEYGVLNQILLSANQINPVVATLIKWVVGGLWLGFTGLLFWLAWRMQDIGVMVRAGLWMTAAAFLSVTVGLFVTGQVTPIDAVGRFDFEPLRWISSPQMAMLCVVLPTVWATSGPGCLLYLAALKTVPSDLYEAADIDGAGLWHKVFYITLPRLKFLIGIQFIAALVGAFKGGTDYILALTGGGPNDATMILALEIFIRTFMDLQFGIGTAMAWLLGLLLVGLTAYQLKMFTRAEFSAGASHEGEA